jgi:hypothetical protein
VILGFKPVHASVELKGQFAFRRVVIDDHLFAIVHRAPDDQPPEARLDLLLNGPFERARAIYRIVAGLHQMRPRGVGQGKLNMTVGKALAEARQLDFHDLLQMFVGRTRKRERSSPRPS